MSTEYIKTKRFVKAWLKVMGEMQLDHQMFSRDLMKKLCLGSPCSLGEFESENLKARRLKALVKKRPAVHFDTEHKIDGHMGLSLNSKACELVLNSGIELGGASAIESLMGIVLTEETVGLKAKCVVTSEELELKVSALGFETDHEKLFLSMYHPDVLNLEICQSAPQWSHFIWGDDAAEQFLSDQPEQILLPISQAFQVAREIVKTMYKDVLK
jgi:hypothetical protein